MQIGVDVNGFYAASVERLVNVAEGIGLFNVSIDVGTPGEVVSVQVTSSDTVNTSFVVADGQTYYGGISVYM